MSRRPGAEYREGGTGGPGRRLRLQRWQALAAAQRGTAAWRMGEAENEDVVVAGPAGGGHGDREAEGVSARGGGGGVGGRMTKAKTNISENKNSRSESFQCKF